MVKYHHPHERRQSLEEAKGLAWAHVGACCDPLAVQIDPACRVIGGKMHMATLTWADGFRWVEPPIGVSA
jgi:hypothetical protein